MNFLKKALWGSNDDLTTAEKDKDKEKDKVKKSKDKDAALSSSAVEADQHDDEDLAFDPDQVAAPEQIPEEGLASVLWQILSSKMGSDVFASGISLPAPFYEPMTILQKTAEVIETSDLLDAAIDIKDPLLRMAQVAAFAISYYSTTCDKRQKTNFNPLLGETFEFVDERNGTRFLAEQVSHHPPVSAFHAQNKNWLFYQNSALTTKFLGNSIDIDTHGRSHIYFNDTEDHFYFTNPKSRVHNIIIGQMWLEHYGELDIVNLKTGDTCNVPFAKAGLFQGAQHSLSGHVRDSTGKKRIQIEGSWKDVVRMKALTDVGDMKKDEERILFQVPERQVDPPYYMHDFVHKLLKFDEDMKLYLPPTDARRRLDRLFLEKGDTVNATKWKRRMEQKQRSDRQARGSSPWKPVWFRKIPRGDDDPAVSPSVSTVGTPSTSPPLPRKENNTKEETGSGKSKKKGKSAKEARKKALQSGDNFKYFEGLWVYESDYWEQRERKISAIKKGDDPGELLCAPTVRDTACDFSHYARVARERRQAKARVTSEEAEGDSPSKTAPTASTESEVEAGNVGTTSEASDE